MKAGKVWGMTEQIEANGVLEFHRIEMNKGGVCSKHLHEFKWNGFFVESGRLKVKVWQRDYDLVDETILEPGQYTKVKPGLYHQFECLESGVAFELYWAELSHNDIKRDTIGYNEEIISNGRYMDLTLTKREDDTPVVASCTPLGETFTNDHSVDSEPETITVTVVDD